MGTIRKRFLVTVPLAAALAVAGLGGTAQAATPAPAPAAAVGPATQAVAAVTGFCTIYANGLPMWEFISTRAFCRSEAARVQQIAPGAVITYTWFGLG
jgi:hypothetical protein